MKDAGQRQQANASERRQAIRRGAARLSGVTWQFEQPMQIALATKRILSPKSWQHEHWLLATLFTISVSLVATIAPGFARATREPMPPLVISHVLALPVQEMSDVDVDTQAQAGPVGASQTSPGEWTTITIKSGQTLGDIFFELGIPDAVMHRLLAHPRARDPLTRILPGAQFHFDLPAQGELRAIRFDRDESIRVTLVLHPDRIDEIIKQRDMQRRIHMASGEITSSLFDAGAKAGLSNGAIVELAKIFGYDIDFAQDLRFGDRFSVVYEEIYRDGERLRAGDILAATFVSQGKRYDAFRYDFADGRREYFDSEGRPMKKSFLRIPIEFARVSSRFSVARKHPVLGITRAHKGVDYAAASGTPIMSAGDGRIAFAGWKNGFGRTVIVDHGRGFTTLYGHMSRLGKAKNGARVRQGEVIGYVGATGLATAPHLHYEFRIGGVHRDPLKVTLPKPEPLPSTELARFQLQTQPLLAKLRLIEGTRAYAAH